ncbi:MAG: helix-turn-helix domain-containing protein [Nitrospira sp.]|nr:helix-turn-helix domain-containing protein [Nitrospira sp.]
MEKQLSAQEVAAVLNVSLRTLEKLVSAGEAPPFYWVGRSRRWEPAAVRNWIARRYGDGSQLIDESLPEGSWTKQPG